MLRVFVSGRDMLAALSTGYEKSLFSPYVFDGFKTEDRTNSFATNVMMSGHSPAFAVSVDRVAYRCKAQWKNQTLDFISAHLTCLFKLRRLLLLLDSSTFIILGTTAMTHNRNAIL